MRFYGGTDGKALLHLVGIAGAHGVAVGAADVHEAPGVVTDQDNVKLVLGLAIGRPLDTAALEGGRAVTQVVIISSVAPVVVIVEAGSLNSCSEKWKLKYLIFLCGFHTQFQCNPDPYT